MGFFTDKIADFERWTKTGISLADIQKSISDVEILKMPPAEAALKAGEKTRQQITAPIAAAGKGLLGPGAVAYFGGEQGYYPDWFPGGGVGQPFGKEGAAETIVKTVETVAEAVKDPMAAGKGLVSIEIPEWPKFPEFPEIPAFPTFDLAGLGAGIGAGLAGIRMPEIPQVPSLTDEKGDPNLLMIGVLAIAGLGGVYLISKG